MYLSSFQMSFHHSNEHFQRLHKTLRNFEKDLQLIVLRSTPLRCCNMYTTIFSFRILRKSHSKIVQHALNSVRLHYASSSVLRRTVLTSLSEQNLETIDQICAASKLKYGFDAASYFYPLFVALSSIIYHSFIPDRRISVFCVDTASLLSRRFVVKLTTITKREKI